MLPELQPEMGLDLKINFKMCKMYVLKFTLLSQSAQIIVKLLHYKQ